MSLPKNHQTDELFRSFLLLRDIDECYMYFEDLCTIKELQAMAQRLEIVKKLDGGASYAGTVESTGASSATVGRVNRCLSYGAGGYRMILDRLEEKKV